jgi:Dyp-type peroxidase family
VTPGFVTVVIPFDCIHVKHVNQTLIRLNPVARLAFDRLPDSESLVHFMSINAIFIAEDEPARLVLEASVDGEESAALAHISRTIGNELIELFAAAGIKLPAPLLLAYLIEHQVKFGAAWSASPGTPFTGAPGLRVGRIRQEALLAAKIGELLERVRAPGFAMDKLEFVRKEIFGDVDMKWAFIAEPVPLLAKPPAHAALRFAWWFTKTLLWPLALPPPLVTILYAFLAQRVGLDSLLAAFLFTLAAEIFLLIIALALLALKLRRDERKDSPLDLEPAAALVREIMNRENHIAQNHLASVSVLKPGRRLILRLVFGAVGGAASFLYPPGFLSGIGTIHFARWLVLPGTDRLLFFSNYDGSWNSYLEDFIVRAHMGLTAIWGNVVNFPKSRWLMLGGASDGARFKRVARRYQQPSYFWYSAYPRLTMTHIRTNAAIRHGFASISSEAAAARWLENFGRYPPPPVRESHEVPTLVFGGLSRLRHSHCLIITLAGEHSDRQNWLRAIAPDLCYGELPPMTPVAVVAGFSARGLAHLGMDPAALATFPTAFQQGMTEACRARALGDQGDNSREHWWWGGSESSAHVVLSLYAQDPGDLQDLVKRHTELLTSWRQQLAYEIACSPLPPKGEFVREPFGFVDGISQPILSATDSAAAPNPLHAIKPGELILGYPDNGGHVAPTPQYQGCDFGRNGTYLVVRQLQQDKRAFEQTASQLSQVAGDYGLNAPISPRWVAAKMLGRWPQDGSPLVDFPSAPKTNGHPAVRPGNDFLYGKIDPHGLRCPLGAHIRRANPRDSFDAGSAVQIGITNRHRIRRVGRSYREGADGHTQHPGLMFMCINADIETQFEFLQQTWLLGRSFEGLNDETDPLLGHHEMSIPTRRGPLRLQGLPNFVTVRGGGYFFMPSKSALQLLQSHSTR